MANIAACGTKRKRKMKKEKNMIAPNECSLLRWIATMVVAMLLGIAILLPPQIMMLQDPQLMQSTFAGIPVGPIFDIFSFMIYFFTMVLALKWIAKTSLKEFILGVGGKLNKKECLTIAGLYAAGFAVSTLMTISNVQVRDTSFGTFLVLFVIMIPLTFMQTTWEELVFRGVFIRWACKNEVGFTGKAIISCVLSSIVFGLMHIANPEISSMTGLELLLGVFCYIAPGVGLYIADLHFGSLVPGIIFHWINNFLAFTVISGEVSALPVPTLFVDTTEQTAGIMFVATILVYVPLMAYILFDRKKRSKAAAAMEV